MEILFSAANILVILFFIVMACVFFTNAVEHLGEELNLSEGAVGSVLAAVGTALPETIVPLVAILGAYVTGANISTAEEIGVGAILGAPFLLGTLAFFVTGTAVYVFTKKGKRTTKMPVNTVIMFRDLHYFAISYLVAILATFIPYPPARHFIGIVLIIMYAVYVFLTVRTASKETETGEEELEALYFTKYLKIKGSWNLPAIIVQLAVSLAAIVFLAHFFVEQLKFIAEVFHINPLILSLIITPIATELPEKFNSVLWIRSKKDTLAMGNITGAMVFQSCIPTAVGVMLTPWVLNMDAFVNVIIVYLSVAVVYLNIVKNKGVLQPSALMFGGIFYLFYLIYIAFKFI